MHPDGMPLALDAILSPPGQVDCTKWVDNRSREIFVRTSKQCLHN